jgi:hypothetical protein
VDFPIDSMVIFHSYVSLPEGNHVNLGIFHHVNRERTRAPSAGIESAAPGGGNRTKLSEVASFSTSHLVFEHIMLCVYRTILLIYIYIHTLTYIYIRILYAVYYMMMCNVYVNISSYFDATT